MCVGFERLKLLRRSYRLGYDSGYADGLAAAAGEKVHQMPENVIDLQTARESRESQMKASRA